jgi:hypothetical protein
MKLKVQTIEIQETRLGMECSGLPTMFKALGLVPIEKNKQNIKRKRSVFKGCVTTP